MARTLVGTRIRERRRAQGMTQVALAGAVGISASYLNLIEHNKRGIAGRTLNALARELGAGPTDLTDGADETVIARLLDLSRTGVEDRAEVGRIEEFVGRYPGWARLLLHLGEVNRTQVERLRALSDRMAQDPFLAETMHEILSNITAIRSTAGILAGSDVPEPLRDRFLGNLARESERLASRAQNLVAFFEAEGGADAPDRPLAPEPTAWPTVLATPGVTVQTTAAPGDPNTASPPDSVALPSSDRQAHLGQAAAQRLAQVVRMMPEGVFEPVARRLAFDPLALAQHFEVAPWQVLWRLAHASPGSHQAGSGGSDFPEFGLIECDMSGAVLLRRSIPALPLPQYASACPLWPLYRAFARPDQVLRAVVDLPSGDRVMCYAVARATGHGGYDMPPMLRSTMAFAADPAVFPAAKEIRAPVLGGIHCSVCPRKACLERRADYILA
ncbi:MAG: short-chain fatty acyl-CoA regulator family protein [Pseudomonadota bacterium]